MVERVLWQSGTRRRELVTIATWSRRGDVTEAGLEPGALRCEAHRVDEMTGVTGAEGLGSHAPPLSRRKLLEIVAATYGT